MAADLDLERAKEAWRVASSADVVRALREIDEYAPEVANTIRAEAGKRELTTDSAEAVAVPNYDVVRKATMFTRAALARTMTFLHVRLRIVRAHPLASAAIVGFVHAIAIFPASYWPRTWMDWRATWTALMVAFYTGLLITCLPLRRYKIAGIVPVIAGTVSLATSIALLGIPINWVGGFTAVMPLKRVVVVFLSSLVSYCGAPAAVLLAAVYLRNRYWPYHKPGDCRVCEYDLRGLPEPRCPECGTPFEA